MVVVDLDHALDLSLSSERLVRGDFRKELQDIWIMLYSYMVCAGSFSVVLNNILILLQSQLPDQRIECALPHPHDV